MGKAAARQAGKNGVSRGKRRGMGMGGRHVLIVSFPWLLILLLNDQRQLRHYVMDRADLIAHVPRLFLPSLS